MTYCIFCTYEPASSDKKQALRHAETEFANSMGAIIDRACTLVRAGTIVWQISGSDGFLMERSDIEDECERRGIGVQASEVPAAMA
jgi:hypothetical protein